MVYPKGRSRYPSLAIAPRRAFTLIELLIVVAIIAILAGIAVPNFLEAQTRSKVSRAKSDMRTIVTALEVYHTDANRYPPSTLVPRFLRLLPLTTPIAYITEVPKDIFEVEETVTPPGPFRRRGNFNYGAMPIDEEKRYALASDAPDLAENSFGIEFYPGYSQVAWNDPSNIAAYHIYDPTNGTVSRGDLWRVSDHNIP
jgi:prepilin-type N-terminal cleavage/methylation domain-containing protein